MRESPSEADFTSHQVDGQALKNGVEEDHGGADYDGGAGQQHRPESPAPASMTAASRVMPCRSRNSMKSTRMTEFLTTMPAPAMKPIMEVAVKNAWSRPCAGRIPTSENGMAAMITRGVTKDWNQPRTSPVDENEDGGEGDAQVAKHLVDDMPFAIPFHRIALGAGGQRSHVLLDGISFGRLELLHRPSLRTA